MKETTAAALVIAARIALVIGCIVLVVVARMSVGWGSLALLFVALAVLLVLLWTYNRRFR